MSIKKYIDTKTGETLWKVYVNIRSKEDLNIREQKTVHSIKSEKAALAEEKKILKELTEKVTMTASQGSTWGAVIDQWEADVRSDPARYPYEPNTIDDHVSCLRRWTNEWLNKIASELNKGDGKDVLQKVEAAGRTKGFQKRVKNTINVVYSWGIEQRLIKGTQESPTKGLQVSKIVNEKVPAILTLEEIKKLLSEAKKHEHDWYPIWAMALLTGMRNGELHALLWTDIDFENKKITVSKSFNKRKKVVKSTKSGMWRTVPISDDLMILLENLKRQTGNIPHVLPRFWQWDQGVQSQVLRAFCIGIGIRSVNFHALRACFATQLLSHDIASARIMKICGWKDLKTMQHYIRLAGVDEIGATQDLKILPSDLAVMKNAAKIYKLKRG